MRSKHIARVAMLPALATALSCATTRRGSHATTPLTIEHVTLIDGTGAPAMTDMSVVIEGNRITRVARSASVRSIGSVIDGRRLYAVPGLWDMHMHLAGVEALIIPRLLANGVTSVRDMGDGCIRLQAIRDSIRRGTKPGPRIYMAGHILESEQELALHRRIRARADSIGIPKLVTAEPGCHRMTVSSAASAQIMVDSVLAAGADFVKARSYADSSVYAAIARAAKARNVTFAAHPPYAVNALASAGAGTTTLEHGFYPWPPTSLSPAERQRMIAMWRAAGTSLVPTFITWENRAIHIDSVRAQIDDVAPAGGTRRAALPDAIARRWKSNFANRALDTRQDITGWRTVLDNHMRDIGEMYRAGIRIMPGTDSPNVELVYPGDAVHDELELFVRGAGLTPLQAIQAATMHPAQTMRIDSLGTIASGMLADIVLVSADPTADIRNLRRVVFTIANGRVVFRAVRE
jgi:imidazolonepropionase-like amidohydrolase